jgi:hypothetical protein
MSHFLGVAFKTICYSVNKDFFLILGFIGTLKCLKIFVNLCIYSGVYAYTEHTLQELMYALNILIRN